MKNYTHLFYVLICLVASWSISSAQTTYRQHQAFSMDFPITSTSETASENPFTDYRLQVEFTQGDKVMRIPGFYAADGNAAETSATEGGVWRVFFTPPTAGQWSYTVSFKKAYLLAVDDDPYRGDPVTPHDGKKGSINVVAKTDAATGFEKTGRLMYNRSAYLYTEDGEPILKFGANSPENFLAYADIDGTYSYDPEKNFLKTWEPHVKDWKSDDPTWKNGKGKGIIGALNYLASKGMNCVYALTLNIEGDARDVWPFLSHEKRDFKRYDVSKLAQWDIIFSHAEKLGVILNLVTQEKENELILDDGYTDVERKLYYRELVARFGYHKNIIWNMGEENGPANFWPQGQNDQQRLAMIRYLKDHDPYKNPLVIHTHAEQSQRDHILEPLKGFDRLDGLSMQISNVFDIHHDIMHWISLSANSTRPWIITMDEIGRWHTGTRPDSEDPAHDTLRQEVLWGTMMAGGGGVEWYFGWLTPPHDLNAEDWRSRNNIWEQTNIAKQFFQSLPYTEMKNTNDLLHPKGNYCFSQAGEIYTIYLKHGGTTQIDLSEASGTYDVQWYDPRNGGSMQQGSVKQLQGGDWRGIGAPPKDPNKDWVIMIKKR